MSLSGVRWEWDRELEEEDALKWAQYDADTTARIELAYSSGNSSIDLSHGFFAEQGGYTINFQEMTQTKVSSGYSRRVRRVAQEPDASDGQTQAFWEWENSGSWVRYDNETNLLLSEAYDKKQPRLLLDHGFFQENGTYTIDFTNLVQINVSTNRQRRIRRTPPARRLASGMHARSLLRAPVVQLELVRCDPAISSSLRSALALFAEDHPQEAPVEDILVD